MYCRRCSGKIGKGEKAYKEPYHKDCYRRIKDARFGDFMAAKGYVVGARVAGKNLLSQTSEFGTILAVRPSAQAHEAVLVEWDGGGTESYPWNYLSVVTDGEKPKDTEEKKCTRCDKPMNPVQVMLSSGNEPLLCKKCIKVVCRKQRIY